MSSTFHGSSSNSKGAAISMAYAKAMAAAKDLPEGANFQITLESADADSVGAYTAMAHLIILDATGAGEKPALVLSVEEERREHERELKKQELAERVMEHGILIEDLEEHGLDLDTLLDLVEEPSLADELLAQWYAYAEMHPELYKPHHVQDIPLQEPIEVTAPTPDVKTQVKEQDGTLEMVEVREPATELQVRSLQENIEAETNFIMQEYVVERMMDWFKDNIQGQETVLDARLELEKITKHAKRELAENILSSVFDIGLPVLSSEQSLGMRLAENVMMDKLIDLVAEQFKAEPSLPKKKPHLDTLDLVG